MSGDEWCRCNPHGRYKHQLSGVRCRCNHQHGQHELIGCGVPDCRVHGQHHGGACQVPGCGCGAYEATEFQSWAGS